jgi:hypothetical protein
VSDVDAVGGASLSPPSMIGTMTADASGDVLAEPRESQQSFAVDTQIS